MRPELHGVKNGNDQTGGNADELLKKKRKNEVRENNSAVHARVCVRSNAEKRLVRGFETSALCDVI